ncbi:MAG: exodeoxyribonuclease VII large subunit [Candidatus Gracilibacteria bacterium]
MEKDTEISTEYYTPASLIGIYNNVIKVKEEQRLIVLEGVYERYNGRDYGGYYYDRIKESLSEYQMTLKMPSVLRPLLNDEGIYQFLGFVERTATKDGNICLRFVVTKLLGEQEKTMSDEEQQIVKIIQQKLTLGHRDIAGFIKKNVYKNEPVRVALLYGHNSIVDQDFKEAIDAAGEFYEFHEFRMNMSSVEDMLDQLEAVDNDDYHIIALVRGGGSGLEIFNHTDLVSMVSQMSPMVISAIGHADDTHWVDKVSDLPMTTPTALGHFFKQTVEDAVTEMSQSKALMIKQMEEQFEKQRKLDLETAALEKLKREQEYMQTTQELKKAKRTNQLLMIGIILLMLMFIYLFFLQ